MLPLAAAGENGECTLVRELTDLAPGTVVLVLVPLAPFHDGRESLQAIAERVLAN